VGGLRSKYANRDAGGRVEPLRAAVDEVLEIDRYALKARKFVAEMAKWNLIGVIAENIDELVAENRQTS
jgi:hypothetical protein